MLFRAVCAYILIRACAGTNHIFYLFFGYSHLYIACLHMFIKRMHEWAKIHNTRTNKRLTAFFFRLSFFVRPSFSHEKKANKLFSSLVAFFMAGLRPVLCVNTPQRPSECRKTAKCVWPYMLPVASVY